MTDAARGEFKADRNQRPQKHDNFSRFSTLLIFGAIAVLFVGSLSRILGGISGAVGLPAIVYLALSSVGLVSVIILAILGLILGLLLPMLFSSTGYRRGGTFRSGGGFYGGGGFGGGFSGGGGGFGGGGASGNW